MIGNLIGQSLNEYVKNEIKIRQKIQGSGSDPLERTPYELNYLNSRLAWVKMASSVEVVDKTPLKPPPPPPSNVSRAAVLVRQGQIPHGEGTKKLKEIFGDNASIDSFLGIGLAKRSVLFNGLTEINTTETEGATKYDFRKGITQNDSIWNNNAYGLGGLEFGIKPPPGIVKVDIQHLNRGSIRKADISLKAFNKKQFEIIELLYLRLGYTMLLEWGNNIYVNDKGEKEDVITTLVDNYWFTNQGNSDHLVNLNKIEEKRRDYQGNYDGFFGRVTNFSWTFAPDGSYDINIQLTSLGDVIESIKVNVYDFKQINISDANKKQEDANRTLDKISDFLFSLKNLTKENELSNQLKIEDRQKTGANYTRLKERIEKLRNNINDSLVRDGVKDYSKEILDLTKIPKTNKKKGFENPFPGSFNDLSTTNDSTNMDYGSFIRFGAFLSFIQEHIIPSITNNGGNQFPILNIDNNQYLNVMYAEPKQFSIDPKVCLVRNNFLSSEIELAGNNTFDIASETARNIENFNQLIPQPWVSNTGEKVIYGNLMNIYLNFNFILSILDSELDKKGNLNLYSFLDKICSGINRTLGGVNNLEPVVDELTNAIKIIDQTVIPGKEQLLEKDDTIIQMYGYNPSNSTSNFVKNFSFETSITPDLSTIIAIGASANNESVGEGATAFSKWNLGLVDRFNKNASYVKPRPLSEKEQIGEIIKTKSNRLEELKIENRGKFLDDSIREQKELYREIEELRKRQKQIETSENLFENYTRYLIDAFAPLRNGEGINPQYFQLNDEFTSRGTIILKNNLLQQENEDFSKTNNPGSSIGFIPFNLSLTLDGISGIKIYNRINTDAKFLPRNYPETMEFIIKQVNHTISNNIWITNLETITVPIVQPKEKRERTLKLLNSEFPPFVFPVDQPAEIRNDAGGLGTFAAPRSDIKDGVKTVRKHKGIDIKTTKFTNGISDYGTTIGTPIYSPITGKLSIKLTKTKNHKKFIIEGTGEYAGIVVELAYVNPIKGDGSLGRTRNNQFVGKGELIGRSVDLNISTTSFPGENLFGLLPGRRKAYSDAVTDHVHYAVYYNGKEVNPTPGVVINYVPRE